MNKILYFLILIITNTAFSQTAVWQDLMNGDNSISGLEARGWAVINADGGGTTDAFYQGAAVVFAGFDSGLDSGYIASNILGENSNGILDQWLISPPLDITAGDSMVFFARSADVSSIQDSIYLYISDDAGTSVSDFTFLTGGNFQLSSTDWQNFWIRFGTSGVKRFAIEYLIHNHNSGYIGLDDFALYRKGSINYPSTITLSQAITFSDPSKQSSYKMIGIPGQSSLLINQFLTGSNNTDWKAFYDNGAQSNYLEEYDGSSKFNLGQGKGFWVISKNQINISSQVNAASLVNGNIFNIPLHTGWNIITNPFTISVNWSLVQSLNALPPNGVIYSWNGSSWTQASSLSPYQGYYFNNIYNLTSISIPYSFTGKVIGKSIAQDKDSKILKLSLLQNNTEKSAIQIGINKNSNNGLDKYDLFAPPGDFDDARIEIDEQNIKTEYKKLFADFRPALNNGQTYNLKIKNTTGTTLLLRAEANDDFSGYKIYLINKNLNNYTDLMDSKTITLNPYTENYDMELVIAPKDSAEAIASNFTPKKFDLYQNYPNPFNPTTIIRYSVPASALSSNSSTKVTLKIYDILGNEITTLVNEEKQPGTYEVQFNGSSFASGIYFYKLSAGNFSQTQKMILLK